jgi:hypothetical protein
MRTFQIQIIYNSTPEVEEFNEVDESEGGEALLLSFLFCRGCGYFMQQTKMTAYSSFGCLFLF